MKPAGAPAELFSGRYADFGGLNYDISPDGRHFLMIKPANGTDPSATQASMIVVLNWFDELKARVPTK